MLGFLARLRAYLRKMTSVVLKISCTRICFRSRGSDQLKASSAEKKRNWLKLLLLCIAWSRKYIFVVDMTWEKKLLRMRPDLNFNSYSLCTSVEKKNNLGIIGSPGVILPHRLLKASKFWELFSIQVASSLSRRLLMVPFYSPGASKDNTIADVNLWSKENRYSWMHQIVAKIILDLYWSSGCICTFFNCSYKIRF